MGLSAGLMQRVYQSPDWCTIVAVMSISRVLNIGGGSKKIPLPAHYAGWEHVLLDISPGADVDLVADARELQRLPAESFDAIYCAHNLEHYYRFEVPQVLQGILRLLKPEGFAEIITPDLQRVLQVMTQHNLALEAELYRSTAGPITVHDVIFGFAHEIQRSGQDYYAHKTGFAALGLRDLLFQAGFPVAVVLTDPQIYELRALAFRQQPEATLLNLLGLPAPPPLA